MAVIPFVKEEAEGGCYRYTWTGAVNGDTFEPAPLYARADATVQLTGTIGGATLTIEASLEKTPTNFFPAQDVVGNNISLAANGGEAISTGVVAALKPVLTGGASSTVNVILLARK